MSDFQERLTSVLIKNSPFSATGNHYRHVKPKATSYHPGGNGLRTSPSTLMTAEQDRQEHGCLKVRELLNKPALTLLPQTSCYGKQ